MPRLKYASRTNAFTLIELLIVVSLIALLATLVFLSLSSVTVRARDQKRLADIRNIQAALEFYRQANLGRYPAALIGGQPLVDGRGVVYLKTVPKDPRDNSDYEYDDTQTDGVDGYHVCFSAEGQNDALTPGLNFVESGTTAVKADLSCAPLGCDCGTVTDTCGKDLLCDNCHSDYCQRTFSDCSDNPSKMALLCPTKPTLGCFCGGGIVYSTSSRLIASPSNCTSADNCDNTQDDPQKTVKFLWQTNDSSNTPDASDREDGRKNVGIATDDGSHPAGEFCHNLRINGFDDWYLPALNELDAMISNHNVPAYLNLDTFKYWSSTQYDATKAWGYDFSRGYDVDPNKCNIFNGGCNESDHVRCIRRY